MEVKTLDFVTQLRQVEELNPSFATGLMRICYHGKNRNGSIIPKETLESAIPTFFNCPIVARYDRKTDKIGSHDMELVVKNGGLHLISATQPVGVVPTNNIYFWENVEEDDGTIHEYLVMPIILWKRQEAVSHILEAENVAQSMECTFDESHENENGETVVDKLTMQAFCLLETAKPCFESAAIDVICSSLQEQFSLMKKDWEELCGSEGFSIAKFDVKGGEQLENEKPVLEEVTEPIDEVVEEAEVAEVTGDLELSEVQIEEHSEVEADVTIGEPVEETEVDAGGEETEETGNAESETEVVGTEAEEFSLNENKEVSVDEPNVEVSVFATYETRRKAIEGALPEIRRTDALGHQIYSEYYWLEDFDDDFAYVGRRVWNKADGESDKRENGRFKYTIGENGEAELQGEFEPMIVRWLTMGESAQLDKERADEKAEIANLKQWYEKYQTERAMSLAEEFDDLKEVEGFSAIMDSIKAGELNYDAAKEKLFTLKGKHMFALEQCEAKSVKVPVVEEVETFSNKGRRYGGIISAK